MICENCKKEAFRIKIRYSEKDGRSEICDLCSGGNERFSTVHDVYFKKPYLDEHLADETHPDGIYVESKGHKAKIMREQNLHERGDRIRGGR